MLFVIEFQGSTRTATMLLEFLVSTRKSKRWPFKHVYADINLGKIETLYRKVSIRARFIYIARASAQNTFN